MKALLLVLLVLLPATAHADDNHIVLMGIDFGLVRLVGTGDFRDPASIFPGYFDAWNPTT